jgi:hypothetical protein
MGKRVKHEEMDMKESVTTRALIARSRALIESRLAEFARDPDESQWKALSEISGEGMFSEIEHREMQAAALKLYYSNPIATGIIETLVNFVIGKDFSVTPADGSKETAAYLKGCFDANDFDMRSKELARRAFRDGEMFLRFFKPTMERDYMRVRFVDAPEIQPIAGNLPRFGIKCDANDVETPIEYQRVYTDENGSKRDERIPADDMVHMKIRVDSNVKRGVSFFVGIAPYLSKYKLWLDDRIKLNRIRSMFNLVGNVTGNGSPVDVAGQFTTPAGASNPSSRDGSNRKTAPKSGGILIGQGIEWKYESLNINASDTKDDGRAILLMIVTGTGMAEHMVTGDASNANYASTMVSESPAVRAFEAWQDVLEKVIKQICRKFIQYGIDSGRIPSTTRQWVYEIDEKTGVETKREVETPTSTEVIINFPILIHRNIKEETEALVMARNNGWISDSTASQRLGFDYQEEQRKLLRESVNGDNRHDKNPEPLPRPAGEEGQE